MPHPMNPDTGVTNQKVNLFSSDKCFVFFISDVSQMKFKCKSWTEKLINCWFSQIKTKHKSTVYLMYLCYFF